MRQRSYLITRLILRFSAFAWSPSKRVNLLSIHQRWPFYIWFVCVSADFRNTFSLPNRLYLFCTFNFCVLIFLSFASFFLANFRVKIFVYYLSFTFPPPFPSSFRRPMITNLVLFCPTFLSRLFLRQLTIHGKFTFKFGLYFRNALLGCGRQ